MLINKILKSNSFYAAHANDSCFDEVQRLALAYFNKQPIVIEGDPGVGKNEAINILSKALNNPIFRIRCTEEMTARDIIGGDTLEAEKSETGALATKVVYAPGKLYQGMEEDTLVVLDEANQLNPSVQKAINSVLEEERTLGSLEGKHDISAHTGFGLFLTYNPGTGIEVADLEVAVKDRCKLFYFGDLPTELKVRILLLKTGKFSLADILTDGFDIRGLYLNKSLGFVNFKDGVWVDHANKKIRSKKVEPYLFYNKETIKSIEFKKEWQKEYHQIAKAIINTLSQIKILQKEGTSTIKQNLKLSLDVVSKINVIVPGLRLALKLMNDYIKLKDMGYSPEEILGELSQSIVDFCVPADLRKFKVGKNLDLTGLIKQISASNGIIGGSILTQLQSEVIKKSKDMLIEELVIRGYSHSIAEGFVDEYTK